MNHLNDEQLVELYYGHDGPGDERRHLEQCSACARTYQALKSDLADMKPVHPPERAEAYGQHVWSAIADRLPIYPSPRKSWFRQPLWMGLATAAACSVVVIAAFHAGRVWEHRRPVPPQVAVAPAPPAPPRVVVVVMSDHLEQSERLLVQLKHANADDQELALPLRDEARRLLTANRKCRQEAEASGDPALATALDHLDDVLTQLANHPDGLNADAIAKLQKEMNTDGLLFEVRVLRSRIPDQQAAVHHHRTGRIA
ncbi:MAG TPA: hypothetical protein VHZ25_01760 [Acidobacteriaceae bacterium]|jgi:hypothetical protein|nr:hypothetical protein [Acidobacteriaceae bacterium]